MSGFYQPHSFSICIFMPDVSTLCCSDSLYRCVTSLSFKRYATSSAVRSRIPTITAKHCQSGSILPCSRCMGVILARMSLVPAAQFSQSCASFPCSRRSVQRLFCQYSRFSHKDRHLNRHSIHVLLPIMLLVVLAACNLQQVSPTSTPISVTDQQPDIGSTDIPSQPTPLPLLSLTPNAVEQGGLPPTAVPLGSTPGSSTQACPRWTLLPPMIATYYRCVMGEPSVSTTMSRSLRVVSP